MLKTFSEASIVDLLYKKLTSVGLAVCKNCKVLGYEIDVLVFENDGSRPIIHVFEVKTRVKPRLIRQLYRRIPFSDYIYVVVPYNLLTSIYRKIDRMFGIVVYYNDDFYVVKPSEFLNNGRNVYKLMMKTSELSFCNMMQANCADSINSLYSHYRTISH
jgi:hypothetical protein